MSATPQCKQIEKHLKDILFNSGGHVSSRQEAIKPPIDNHNQFAADSRCFVSNIEKHLPTVSPFNDIIIPSSDLIDQTGTSQLIDLKNLNTFAAKHINDSTFNSNLGSLEMKLPHPDLEDDSSSTSCLKNGQPPISVLLNSITKEIQNSPNFIGMPENPLHQRRDSVKSHQNDSRASPNSQGFEGDNKARRRKQKKDKKKSKMKVISKGGAESPHLDPTGFRKLLKEHMPAETSKTNFIDVKAIEKRPEQVKLPDIKIKKNKFHNLVKFYQIGYQEARFKFHCHLCSYGTDLKDNIIKHLNHRNHTALRMQADTDVMLPILPEPLPEQAEAISELLLSVTSAECLTDEDIEVRKALSSRFSEVLKTHLPGCTVVMIGSSAYGCGLKKSDTDFILNVEKDEDLPICLEKLWEFLKSNTAYSDVVNEFTTKRPSIKFVDKETSLRCNVLVDNSSSIKLANILATYFKLDVRALMLARAIWYWSEICQINNQRFGTLPSFSFALLVVHFLQQVQPPVLPVLHEVKDYQTCPMFFEKYLKEERWKSQNNDSIGLLWLKFFRFYNFDYTLARDVVCIRTSKRVTTKENNWGTRFYAIEEPFSRRNVAFVIPTFAVCHYIEECFVKTFRYFGYPQSKKMQIKLKTDESFDTRLFEFLSSASEIQDGQNESEESGNEDFDNLNDSLQGDLEDHDPDLSMDDFVSTMSNMSFQEEVSVEKSDTVAGDTDSVVKKDEEREKLSLGVFTAMQGKLDTSWDVKGKNITKNIFHYEFVPVTFKGEKSPPMVCKECKSSAHLKAECTAYDLPKPNPLPPMTRDFDLLICKALKSVKERNAVAKADIDRIIADMRDVEGYIKNIYPGASLKLFGSFCNGFGFKSKSDMDFCLTFDKCDDPKELDSGLVIRKVAAELDLHPELSNVLAITSAKVPIVKFTWQKSGLEGDISLYNTLAIANTEMLETYSKIDTRVEILGYALKYFAKLLGICDASRGSLSSYAYILMVIYFLQQRNPPVIPVLQELYEGEKPEISVEGWNVWFFRDISKLKEVWSDYNKNNESIGQLWVGLLNFYTCDFNWKEYVVSIKQKKLLTRFRKLWNTNQLAIEDPFDLQHNLGSGLSLKMNSYILKTFIKGRERFGNPVKIPPSNELRYFFNRNSLNGGTEPPQDRGCGNCGKIGHIARNCPTEKICSLCRQPGHLIKNCPKKHNKNKRPTDRDKKKYDAVTPQNFQQRDIRETYKYGRNSNQNMKNEHHILRTFPGMQQTGPINNSLEGQKLIQKGVPMHRLPPQGLIHPPPGLPPPGFQPRVPPPGFMPNGPPPSAPNFTPPFNNQHMNVPPPFTGRRKNDIIHPHSPPKHYASSPPKSFMSNKVAFHGVQPDPTWQMSHGRQGFQVERHPAAQLSRGMSDRLAAIPGPRNMPDNNRHMVPPGTRHVPPWQSRPFLPKDQLSYPKSNQNIDHRHLRTKPEPQEYNLNNLDHW